MIMNAEYETVLVRSADGAHLTLPNGHIDASGSPEQAAVEVGERLGLHIAVGGLRRTIVHNYRINSTCPRIGGDHHNWWVYEVDEFEGELAPEAMANREAEWWPPTETNALTMLTYEYLTEHAMTQEEWRKHSQGYPLEPTAARLLLSISHEQLL